MGVDCSRVGTALTSLAADARCLLLQRAPRRACGRGFSLSSSADAGRRGWRQGSRPGLRVNRRRGMTAATSAGTRHREVGPRCHCRPGRTAGETGGVPKTSHGDAQRSRVARAWRRMSRIDLTPADHDGDRTSCPRTRRSGPDSSKVSLALAVDAADASRCEHADPGLRGEQAQWRQRRAAARRRRAIADRQVARGSASSADSEAAKLLELPGLDCRCARRRRARRSWPGPRRFPVTVLLEIERRLRHSRGGQAVGDDRRLEGATHRGAVTSSAAAHGLLKVRQRARRTEVTGTRPKQPYSNVARVTRTAVSGDSCRP